MSADVRYILEVIPKGRGYAIDLGGGKGLLKPFVEAAGYSYLNLDYLIAERQSNYLVSDAHWLPIKADVISLLISKDSFEHFKKPWAVIDETYRILKPGGIFILWVPFLHPFHGDDYYRYTPLGLKYLLREFEILSFESPLWVCSLFASIVSQLFKKIRMETLAQGIRRSGQSIDRFCSRFVNSPSSHAAAYRIVARKNRLCNE